MSVEYRGALIVKPHLTRAVAKWIDALQEVRHEDTTKFPSIWCSFCCGEELDEGTEIIFNGNEKSRGDESWVQYICDYLMTLGYKVNGTLYGHESGYAEDWKIIVTDNKAMQVFRDKDW